jgi:hypothetical protein
MKGAARYWLRVLALGVALGLVMFAGYVAFGMLS